MAGTGGQTRPLHWTSGQDTQRNLGSPSPATSFLLTAHRASGRGDAQLRPELSLGPPSLDATPRDLCLHARPCSHRSQETSGWALLYPSHPLGPELGLSMMQIWASLLCFQMLGPRCHPSNCSAGSSHGGPMASGPPFHSTCVHSLVPGTLTSLQAHRGSGPLHVLLPRPVTPSSSVPH